MIARNHEEQDNEAWALQLQGNKNCPHPAEAWEWLFSSTITEEAAVLTNWMAD